MILGLALVPSKSFQEEVNAYRKRYDTHYAQIMPHITIKSQFEIDDNELDSIKEEVKNVLVTFNQLMFMQRKLQVLHQQLMLFTSKVAKTDSLEKLFDQFNTDEFYGKAEHPFVPHFTIAQGLSSQEFEDIYGQVKLAGVDHKETINELSLLQYSEEDDKWTVVETFELDN